MNIYHPRLPKFLQKHEDMALRVYLLLLGVLIIDLDTE